MRACSLALVSCVLLAARSSGEGVTIDHRGVDCVVAGRFPQLRARLVPAALVTGARVRFCPEGGRHWYSVPMKPDGDAFTGVLPRPRKQLTGFTYYIEVIATDLSVSRSPEHAPIVAAGPTACKDEVVAASLSTAVVDLEVPAGASVSPPGFMADVAVEEATAGAGMSTAGIAGIVGGGAALAGAVAAGGSGRPDSSPGPTGPASTATPSTTAPPATVPPTGTTLSGHWTGFCDLREETPNGVCVQELTLVADLTQAGNDLAGSLVATTRTALGPCTERPGDVHPGTVTGSVQGDRVDLVARYSSNAMTMTGTVVGASMGGAITATSSNAVGTWRLDR